MLTCFAAAANAQTAAPAPAAPASGKHAAHGKAAAKPEPKPVYRLIKFMLGGTDRVDTDALIATLPQHKGDIITPEEIRDNTAHIQAVLNAKHIHGDLTTATLEKDGPGHDILVYWEVHPVDALTYQPSRVPRHFASQTFTGNAALTTAQLEAATGLKAGQDMPPGSLGDARTGIEQAYDAALPNKNVAVSGGVRLGKDHSVVINWRIVEPK